MGRRSEHSRDEQREMAIDVASQIVEQEGFQALTARKVAAGIGYTVGTLYHIFRNFDDLVLHVNGRTLDQMGALIAAQARKRRKPEARIRAMAQYYVQYATDHPNRWRLVFEHQSAPGHQEPERVKQRRDAMFEMVADNLRALAPQRASSDITHTATALWSGIHGICILALTGNLYLGGAFSMQKLINTLIDPVLEDFATS
jgi:AcrR family transcriptional regulator